YKTKWGINKGDIFRVVGFYEAIGAVTPVIKTIPLTNEETIRLLKLNSEVIFGYTTTINFQFESLRLVRRANASFTEREEKVLKMLEDIEEVEKEQRQDKSIQRQIHNVIDTT
ncbi:MAG: hypothetical protein WC942_11655, partial [Clostridia bacterium]